MTHRTQVQLIDKTRLRSSVWLTFWDGKDRAQLSIQVSGDALGYDVGDVFTLDRVQAGSKVELTPVREHVDAKLLLIPRKPATRSGAAVKVRRGSWGALSGKSERTYYGFADPETPHVSGKQKGVSVWTKARLSREKRIGISMKKFGSLSMKKNKTAVKRPSSRSTPIQGTIVK